MKIAFLTTDNREMSKRYDSPEPYFGPATEALLRGFELLEGIEVHVVSCLRQPANAPEKIGRNLWFHGLTVPKAGWMTSAYLGATHAVRKKLREINPDLVHGQGTEKDCAMEAVLSGFPNVLSILGNMGRIAEMRGARPFSFYWIASRLEKFALARTTGVFCNSGHTESLVRPRAKKLWRVANALRLPFFEPPCQEGSRPENAVPTLVTVGSITPLKRQMEILAIAEQLHGAGYRVRFVFVGSGSASSPYMSAFLAKIKEAEEKGYGAYLGTKSYAELIALFDSADAMVHLSAEESFGLVAAEALSRNLKFFGSAIGGLLDIADKVEMAELHPLGDDESVKRGIIEWLEKGAPKPREAAGEIRRRYHPKVIAARHLEIYREVLGR